MIEKMMASGRNETERRAQNDIAQNRRGLQTLKVTKDGEPVQARVSYALLRHDFAFGCNLFMLDQYDDQQQQKTYHRQWEALFNTAVVPLYWEGTEPMQGYLRYDQQTPNDVYRRPPVDRVVAYCREHGLDMKGHPLFWHEFIPRWLPERWETLFPLIEKRFQEISERYAAQIPVFDVVNEPGRIWDMCHEHRSDGYKMVAPPNGYVEQIFALAQQYFPKNTKILNEAVGTALCEFKGVYGAYYQYVEKLLQKGVAIDSVGLQCHTDDTPYFQNIFNGQRLYGVLDGYAALGKPLVMSEVSISTENEEEQAMAAEQLYKICYSHPSMTGVFWWNLDDSGIIAQKDRAGAAGENLPYGGLARNGRPKAAYRALEKLIRHDWHTQGEALLSNGTMQFEGFYGDYQLVIEGEGFREERVIQHRANQSQKIKLEL